MKSLIIKNTSLNSLDRNRKLYETYSGKKFWSIDINYGQKICYKLECQVLNQFKV